MGKFSWLTADKKTSIKIEPKKVYLLQPNGEKPIAEDWYGGYGMFGKVDAYEWVAERNISENYMLQIREMLSKDENLELRSIGISMYYGSYYLDTETNKQYINDSIIAKLFNAEYFWNFGFEIRDGMDAITLISKKIWVKKDIASLFGGLNFPLKFSHNKNAVYEELPMSLDCPNQGY